MGQHRFIINSQFKKNEMYRILGQTQYIGNQWKSVGNILVPK